jgi:hypothetical protein
VVKTPVDADHVSEETEMIRRRLREVSGWLNPGPEKNRIVDMDVDEADRREDEVRGERTVERKSEVGNERKSVTSKPVCAETGNGHTGTFKNPSKPEWKRTSTMVPEAKRKASEGKRKKNVREISIFKFLLEKQVPKVRSP